jgi:hypothetical protein
MNRPTVATLLALPLIMLSCSGSNAKSSAATAVATAPPPQNTVIRTATPPPAATATTRSSDVVRLTTDVKLLASDLPAGFRPGQLEGYLDNESAAVGFSDPQSVVTRMLDTGRLGGLAQGLTTTDGAAAAGDTIDVWRDAAGAKQYFDRYPDPGGDTKFSRVDLPHPVGDQSFALHVETNGQAGYVVNWRRGRLLLGVGETFPAGKDSLDKIMVIVDALDKKAQAATQ